MRRQGVATAIGVALLLGASAARAWAASDDALPTARVPSAASQMLHTYRILAAGLGFEEQRLHSLPDAPGVPMHGPATDECSRLNAPRSSEADACAQPPAALRFELP